MKQLWLVVGLLWVGVAGARMEDPARYEKEVAALEAKARKAGSSNAVVFIGSSNIRLWSTLAEDFAPWPVLNQGFGGGHLSDVAHFAGRLVTPFHPRAVVISAGVNDIHFGRTPEEVFGSATAAVARIQADRPALPVLFVSLLPAPSRSNELERIRATNRLIADWAAGRAGVTYVESFDVFQRPEGGLRDELFIGDRLHHTREAYRLRAERIRPALEKALSAGK